MGERKKGLPPRQPENNVAAPPPELTAFLTGVQAGVTQHGNGLLPVLGLESGQLHINLILPGKGPKAITEALAAAQEQISISQHGVVLGGNGEGPDLSKLSEALDQLRGDQK